MTYLKALIVFFILSYGASLSANTVWLLEQSENLSLVLQKQKQGKSLIQVYKQDLSKSFSPEFQFQRQGLLHGVTYIGDVLHFVFPKSVYKLVSKDTLKIVGKTFKDHVYVGGIGSDQLWYWVFKNIKTGECSYLKEGSHDLTLIPELDSWKDAPVLPWMTKDGRLAILAIRDKGKKLDFSWLELSDRGVAVKHSKLEDFSFGAFAEDDQGFWLLPSEGTAALFWNNGVFEPKSLLPLPEPHKRWLAKSHFGYEDLYVGLKGRDVILYKGDEPITLEKEPLKEGVDAVAKPKQLLEQLVLYFLLILSFVFFIQWRSRFHEQLILKSDRKIVWTQKAAPIFTRGLAFFMDAYFVSLPVLFVSAYLYNVGLEGFELQDFIELQTAEGQQSELAMRIQELMPVIMTLVGVISFYHVMMEHFFGGSLGKLFFRLQVVSVDGQRLKWGQSIIRSLFRILDLSLPIPPSLFFMLVSPLRQSLGDKVAKTQVVLKAPS